MQKLFMTYEKTDILVANCSYNALLLSYDYEIVDFIENAPLSRLYEECEKELIYAYDTFNLFNGKLHKNIYEHVVVQNVFKQTNQTLSTLLLSLKFTNEHSKFRYNNYDKEKFLEICKNKDNNFMLLYKDGINQINAFKSLEKLRHVLKS